MLTAVQIVWNVRSDRTIKLEKILKDSLDLIPSPSPSVKIKIIGGNYWQELGKKLLDDVNNFFVFKTKSLLTTPSNVLFLHLNSTSKLSRP